MTTVDIDAIVKNLVAKRVKDLDKRTAPNGGRVRQDPSRVAAAPASEGAGIINRPAPVVEKPTEPEKAEPTKLGTIIESLGSDVILDDLTPAQVRRIIGVGVCASTDKSRPILESINFKWQKNPNTGTVEFVFAATDSYVLGKLLFEAYPTYRMGHKRIDVNVPFKEFKEAATNAIKAAGKVNPKIKLHFGERDVKVEAHNFETRVRYTEGTYPNYEQLIGTKARDAEGLSGPLPSFSPTILEQITKAFSPTKGERKFPMQMFFTPKDGDVELTPMGFTTLAEGTRLDVIIMPTRVAK